MSAAEPTARFMPWDSAGCRAASSFDVSANALAVREPLVDQAGLLYIRGLRVQPPADLVFSQHVQLPEHLLARLADHRGLQPAEPRGSGQTSNLPPRGPPG